MDLRNRFAHHRRDAPWWGKHDRILVARIEAGGGKTAEELARLIERLLIAHNRPVYNGTHNREGGDGLGWQRYDDAGNPLDRPAEKKPKTPPLPKASPVPGWARLPDSDVYTLSMFAQRAVWVPGKDEVSLFARPEWFADLLGIDVSEGWLDRLARHAVARNCVFDPDVVGFRTAQSTLSGLGVVEKADFSGWETQERPCSAGVDVEIGAYGFYCHPEDRRLTPHGSALPGRIEVPGLRLLYKGLRPDGEPRLIAVGHDPRVTWTHCEYHRCRLLKGCGASGRPTYISVSASIEHRDSRC
ncbi:hypothetical protein [Ferrimonas marina]|uniref:hypothetical protein n=1 Tax=Ferrimonas marina TaxID=299255 RepID=UPI00116114D7|nr:hypothetical protein [Ferrimonas marina]